MEPMALGSSPNSPTSGAPGFLPPYLMGQQEASTPKQATLSSSPLNRNSAYNLSTNEGISASPIIKQRLFGPLGPEPTPVTDPDHPKTNKPGPPRQGLFDTIDITKHSSPYALNNDSSFNFSTSYSLNTSPMAQNENSNNWITVFGFGSESLATVLTIFSHCGTVVEKKIPSQGNWVNLRYSTKHEAVKALSLNGKVLANSVMIGVTPFFERNTDKENIDTSKTIYSSPMRVRSLKHSFVSPQSSDTVLPMQNVPHKSTGIVTKAMEYVFGW